MIFLNASLAALLPILSAGNLQSSTESISRQLTVRYGKPTESQRLSCPGGTVNQARSERVEPVTHGAIWSVDEARRISVFFGDERVLAADFDTRGPASSEYTNAAMVYYGSDHPGWLESDIDEILGRIGLRTDMGAKMGCRNLKISGQGRSYATQFHESAIVNVTENSLEFDWSSDYCRAPLYGRYFVSLVEPRAGKVRQRIPPEAPPSGYKDSFDFHLLGPEHHFRLALDDISVLVDEETFKNGFVGDALRYGVDVCDGVQWPWPPHPNALHVDPTTAD